MSFFHASPLLIAALWSPAGKGLTSLLLFVMSNCDFVTFPCGILCQVWYLIAMIPNLCRLSYLVTSLHCRNYTLFFFRNGQISVH